MPFFSFYWAHDLRAYSPTQTIEAPDRASARRMINELQSNHNHLINDETDVSWDSAGPMELEIETCSREDYGDPIDVPPEVRGEAEPTEEPLHIDDAPSGIAALNKFEETLKGDTDGR